MREVRSWGIGELEVDPVLWGYSPNKKLQREATHTGDAQYAEVKLVPSRTSLSKAGVWIIHQLKFQIDYFGFGIE